MARLARRFFAPYLFCILALWGICNAEIDGSGHDYSNPSEMVGKWYVVSAVEHKNPNIHPKCWSIELSEESGLLKGVSKFFDTTTHTWITVNFQARHSNKFSDGDLYNVDVVVNGGTKGAFVFTNQIPNQNYVSIKVRGYGFPIYYDLEMIIGRESETHDTDIVSRYVPIENMDCSENLGSVPDC